METSRSPRTVLNQAHGLARTLLPDHSSRFSRHAFTLAQLFACLVLREFFGLSYRRTEQLLGDSPLWLADIGLCVAPEHNTLWRAFDRILHQRFVDRALDWFAGHFDGAGLLRLASKPLALDSTCFEYHHRSAHHDRRCRQMAGKRTTDAEATSSKTIGKSGSPGSPDSWGRSVNAARRRRVRSMPKLQVAVASACHLILAIKVRSGNGSDAPDFDELLYRSWKRTPVKVVVADAGYDSEANHRIARQDMRVRSIIPPGIGRPTDKLPSGRWRRHMAKRIKGGTGKKLYGQRAQSETVHSMIKRNMGSALRSRTPERKEKEMMLRALTHNITLLAAEREKKG